MKHSARLATGFNLGLDYLYLLLYANTIAMALLWLTEGLSATWLTTLATALAWGQWLAAGLDAIENLFAGEQIQAPRRRRAGVRRVVPRGTLFGIGTHVGDQSQGLCLVGRFTAYFEIRLVGDQLHKT